MLDEAAHGRTARVFLREEPKHVRTDDTRGSPIVDGQEICGEIHLDNRRAVVLRALGGRDSVARERYRSMRVAELMRYLGRVDDRDRLTAEVAQCSVRGEVLVPRSGCPLGIASEPAIRASVDKNDNRCLGVSFSEANSA